MLTAEQPVPGATLDELSIRIFKLYWASVVATGQIEANHRTDKEKLAAFRLYDLQRDLPTVAGLLTVGINPRYHLPGAYVQFLRFGGSSMTEVPSDQAEIDGDLDTVARALHDRVAANNPTRLIRAEGFRESQRQDYPEWALRELLHNALIHRDYASTSPIRFNWFDDRIEILNPGGIYGPVTAETLTRRSAYRNPAIAEAMKNLGYVNRFGYGIQRAQALLLENGNPPAEFEADAAYFQVVVRRSGS
jgi:ATP-dependent DNA helicase RecG